MHNDQELTNVFKALADPVRRRILDIVRNKPAINVNELSAHFEISRFAIRKHVLVLEKAGLINHEWQRPEKKYYFNAVPFQFIYDRYLSDYSRLWAAQLTSLKYNLEEKSMKQIHSIIIKTTIEKLWHAIIDADMTEKYYMGCRFEGELKAGSKITYTHGDEVRVSGEIKEINSPHKLVHTFIAHMNGQASNESLVTYELIEMGDAVKLTIVHENIKENELFEATNNGWLIIVSGLKTLIETGSPLKLPAP